MSETEKQQGAEVSQEAENPQGTGNPPGEEILRDSGSAAEASSPPTLPEGGCADGQKGVAETPGGGCADGQKDAAEKNDAQAKEAPDGLPAVTQSPSEPSQVKSTLADRQSGSSFVRDLSLSDEETEEFLKKEDSSSEGTVPSVDEELLKWMQDYSFQPKDVANVHSRQGKVLILSPEAVKGHDWWFIGDIHGDIRALKCMVGKIRSISKDSRIVFLGDIFDRNLEDGGFETVKCFLSLLRNGKNGEIVWLAGNHDTSLQYDEGTQKFPIATNRSEFAGFLNEHPELHAFGRELVRIIATLPEAVVFPDGLIAVHGGVPHVDVSETIKTLEDFETKACSNDFTWGRMTEAKFKFPDRSSRGHELGRKDFEKFCDRSAKVFEEAGGPKRVSGIVFGHQHLLTSAVGYKKFESYPANPPSVCLYSSFMLEPVMAWGTNALYATPCAYHRRSDGTYEVCGFVPKEGGRLDAELREEAQKRIDADDE